MQRSVAEPEHVWTVHVCVVFRTRSARQAKDLSLTQILGMLSARVQSLRPNREKRGLAAPWASWGSMRIKGADTAAFPGRVLSK